MQNEKSHYFSIVIPLYNKERHILDAVNSILNQTYQNFEIIIVNDGSKDNSLEKVSQVLDPRLKVISQDNAGVSVARNKGIENSSYEYIAFLDADDEWNKYFLEEINKLIIKFPENGWYATGYAHKKDNKLESLVPKTLKDKDLSVDFFEYSLFELLIHIDSTVIKKSSFKKAGIFPAGVTHGEDQDLFARLALSFPLAYSGVVGSYYILDSDNRACNNVKVAEAWPFLKNYNNLIRKINYDINKEVFVNEYVLVRMISRARALKNNNKTVESLKLMLEYRNSILFKKMWIINFIICLIPNNIFKFLKKIVFSFKGN